MPLVKTQFPSMFGGVVLVTLEREYYVELLQRPLLCLCYIHTSWPKKPKAFVCMCANACMSSGARDGEGSRRRSKRRKLTFILGRRVNFPASGLRGDRRLDFHATDFQAQQHSGCSQVGSRKTCNMRAECRCAGFKWFHITF